jgi:hypothetical protein
MAVSTCTKENGDRRGQDCRRRPKLRSGFPLGIRGSDGLASACSSLFTTMSTNLTCGTIESPMRLATRIPESQRDTNDAMSMTLLHFVLRAMCALQVLFCVESGGETLLRYSPEGRDAGSSRDRIEGGRALEEHSSGGISHPDSAKPRHGKPAREADRSLVQRRNRVEKHYFVIDKAFN